MENTQTKEQVMCMWCNSRPATDEHHLFQRSTSPQLKTDKNNLVKLCRICHQYCTDNAEVAALFQHYFFLKQKEEKLSMRFIAEELQNKNYLSPRDITRYKAWLTGEYYFINSMYIDSVAEYNRLMQIERPLTKSKTDAELKVDATQTGKDVHFYKRTLYAIEDMQKTLFTLIMQYDKEAKNSM